MRSRETSGAWASLSPQNCNVFTCHSSISLFAFVFSLRQEITYLTAQQWEREGWEMRQRNRLISFRGEGRRQEALLLSCNWETNAKVIAVELELGEGRDNSWDVGYHRRLWGNKRWFFRVCRWRETVFILPCRLFVPKQSHFVPVLIYAGSPRMTPDLRYLATCLGWHFLLRQRQWKIVGSLHRCLAHSQRWAWRN